MSNEHEASSLKHALNKTMDAVGGMVGQTSAAMASSAKMFAPNAAISDMYEIEAGRIAQERGRAPEVREAGEKMIRDHTESTTKLKEAVGRSGKVQLSELPTQLDARRSGMIDHLREAPDDKFDATYIDQQVAAHKEAVTMMHTFRKEGDCPILRGFAEEVSPVIESHLERMKQLGEVYS